MEAGARKPDKQREKGYDKAWEFAHKHKITNCFYCWLPFTAERPPTFDHIMPVSKGGKDAHGRVLACDTCNNCRGDAPFMEYVAAVFLEHQAAEREQRGFRRPKYRHFRLGQKVVMTGSRAEWRAMRATEQTPER